MKCIRFFLTYRTFISHSKCILRIMSFYQWSRLWHLLLLISTPLINIIPMQVLNQISSKRRFPSKTIRRRLQIRFLHITSFLFDYYKTAALSMKIIKITFIPLPPSSSSPTPKNTSPSASSSTSPPTFPSTPTPHPYICNFLTKHIFTLTTCYEVYFPVKKTSME